MGRIERLLIVIFVFSLLFAVGAIISAGIGHGEEGVVLGYISFCIAWLFFCGWILNSAYGTKAKATALRKSAMVDLESNQLLSAKIKFQELGEHNIVQEINATLNKQSSPHDKSIQNQVQNITITNITDSAMSGDISVMGTKKDNN